MVSNAKSNNGTDLIFKITPKYSCQIVLILDTINAFPRYFYVFAKTEQFDCFSSARRWRGDNSFPHQSNIEFRIHPLLALISIQIEILFCFQCHILYDFNHNINRKLVFFTGVVVLKALNLDLDPNLRQKVVPDFRDRGSSSDLDTTMRSQTTTLSSSLPAVEWRRKCRSCTDRESKF